MVFNIKLEQYQGPLDVLLALIEGSEVDITNVALAKVTESYVAYLEKMPETATGEIADFLVVAARLLYLKSELLLPEEEKEPEDHSLEEQLRLYKRFMDAAHDLEKTFASNQQAYYRDTPPLTGEFIPPKEVTGNLLAQVMGQIIGIHTRTRKIVERVSIQKVISIEESIARIRAVLQTGKRVLFHQLFGKNADRGIRIVHFLALLELVKQHHVRINQPGLFKEIHITAV